MKAKQPTLKQIQAVRCAPQLENLRNAGTVGPSLRVLVVEDFAPFQRCISSILRKKGDLQVICEVADGLEAVQKADEMQPDLIFLDIGLPTLNGIEAARQIRKVAPESRIIFLSQESSADVVQEALATGAWGYVLKMSATSDLLAAVEAVCVGRQFVSGLLGQYVTDASPRPAAI